MELDPAYTAISGYANEWDAASEGCPIWTDVEYGAQAVRGVAETAGTATGAAAGSTEWLTSDDTGAITIKGFPDEPPDGESGTVQRASPSFGGPGPYDSPSAGRKWQYVLIQILRILKNVFTNGG
jgi:hypothetical protein